MKDTRGAFYRETLQEFIPDRQASVLVVAGGPNDRDALVGLGFTDVVISNLNETACTPFRWERQDAHHLTYADDAFDFVIVHAALHHCSSPHAALVEMYRVARRGVLAIEARDSRMARTLVRLGLSPDYEPSAVYFNDSRAGGVNDSEIPNFIYRWTEREVEKTIAAAAPHAVHAIRYRYGWSPPHVAALERGRLKHLTIRLALPAYRLFARAFPRQQNQFAFYIPVAERLQPWLELRDGEPRFDTAWGQRTYH